MHPLVTVTILMTNQIFLTEDTDLICKGEATLIKCICMAMLICIPNRNSSLFISKLTLVWLKWDNKSHFHLTKVRHFTFVNKIQFCETKLDFVQPNWLLLNKSEFCFCYTKMNFVEQNWILLTKLEMSHMAPHSRHAAIFTSQQGLESLSSQLTSSSPLSLSL